MPAVGFVVMHFVESGWIYDAEAAVGVLAVQTLLVAIDHGFPVEATRVLYRAPVRKAAEVVSRQQLKERRWEPLVKRWCRRINCCEQEASRSQIMVEVVALRTVRCVKTDCMAVRCIHLISSRPRNARLHHAGHRW